MRFFTCNALRKFILCLLGTEPSCSNENFPLISIQAALHLPPLMADSTRVLVIDDSVLARKLPTENFVSNPEMPDPAAISQ